MRDHIPVTIITYLAIVMIHHLPDPVDTVDLTMVEIERRVAG
jgi:hypothetical protein